MNRSILTEMHKTSVIALFTLILGAFSARATTFAVGSLNQARYEASAVLLPDGTDLVTGGLDSNGQPQMSGEIYDPVTRTFRLLTATMSVPRFSHSSILLSDGRVLLAGGTSTATSDIYDPASGKFTSIASMHGHLYVPATRLADGRVLIAGGAEGNNTYTTPVEIFDPSTNTWSAAGSLTVARFGQATLLLTDGRVLIAGGRGATDFAPNEIYDPNAMTSTVLSDPTTFSQPIGVGVDHGRSVIVETTSVFLFEELQQQFVDVTAGLLTSGQSIVVLPSGLLLLTGGLLGSDGSFSALIIAVDPDSGMSESVGAMTVPRDLHVAVTLQDGSVLIAGGVSSSQYVALASAEIYAQGAKRRTVAPR